MKQYSLGFISGACLIASTFLFLGAKGYPDVIKTNEIQIVDRETGRLALHLYASSGSGGIVISRTDETENASKIVLGWESNGG